MTDTKREGKTTSEARNGAYRMMPKRGDEQRFGRRGPNFVYGLVPLDCGFASPVPPSPSRARFLLSPDCCFLPSSLKSSLSNKGHMHSSC